MDNIYQANCSIHQRIFARTRTLPRASETVVSENYMHYSLHLSFYCLHYFLNSLLLIFAFNFTNTLSYFLPLNCLRQQKVHKGSRLHGEKKASCAMSLLLHESPASSGSAPSRPNHCGPDGVAASVTFLLHWTKVMWGCRHGVRLPTV